MLKVKVEMDGNFFCTSKCDSQENLLYLQIILQIP